MFRMFFAFLDVRQCVILNLLQYLIFRAMHFVDFFTFFAFFELPGNACFLHFLDFFDFVINVLKGP